MLKTIVAATINVIFWSAIGIVILVIIDRKIAHGDIASDVLMMQTVQMNTNTVLQQTQLMQQEEQRQLMHHDNPSATWHGTPEALDAAAHAHGSPGRWACVRAYSGKKLMYAAGDCGPNDTQKMAQKRIASGEEAAIDTFEEKWDPNDVKTNNRRLKEIFPALGPVENYNCESRCPAPIWNCNGPSVCCGNACGYPCTPRDQVCAHGGGWSGN